VWKFQFVCVGWSKVIIKRKPCFEGGIAWAALLLVSPSSLYRCSLSTSAITSDHSFYRHRHGFRHQESFRTCHCWTIPGITHTTSQFLLLEVSATRCSSMLPSMASAKPMASDHWCVVQPSLVVYFANSRWTVQINVQTKCVAKPSLCRCHLLCLRLSTRVK